MSSISMDDKNRHNRAMGEAPSLNTSIQSGMGGGEDGHGKADRPPDLSHETITEGRENSQVKSIAQAYQKNQSNSLADKVAATRGQQPACSPTLSQQRDIGPDRNGR